ncbi:MAG TPA: hypothetical protein VMY88_04135 [Acidimicrobiales bacterium]|nr:hypothetical protein [Acidimicrobiales bacterium]
MGKQVPTRRRPRRKIVCRSDGSMFDVEQRRRISVEELRDHLVGGGNFEAETEETGRDCTFEVLRKLMGGGALDPMSAQGGLPLPGLGSLGVLTDLMGLARTASEKTDSRDRDSEPGPRRPRRRGRSADWADTPTDGDSA